MLEQLQKEFDGKFTWQYLPHKRHLKGDKNEVYNELINWIDKNFVPVEAIVGQVSVSPANGETAGNKKPTDRERMIHAWRTLYYGDLLSDKEKDNISKKLNNRYKA